MELIVKKLKPEDKKCATTSECETYCIRGDSANHIVHRLERSNLFDGVRLSAVLIYESKSGEMWLMALREILERD